MSAGKPEQRRPFGRSTIRWVTNITIKFRQMGYKDVKWIEMVYTWVQWFLYVNIISGSVKAVNFLTSRSNQETKKNPVPLN
jgi:hypothetical protein